MSRFLGQVFLKNRNIQKRIADYVLGLNGDCLVEIGPGSGALTKYVYVKCLDKFVMVELDKRFIDHLRDKFPLAKLIHGDILNVTFDDLAPFGKNILFGNIPYYITSPIIMKFLREPLFSEAVFMVQKEYYEVISAPWKTNRYSCMSVLVQSFVSINKVIDVDRNQFSPVPKVDSTVVHLVKDKNLDVDLEKYSLFLRKCFAMPRKTLWNNLKRHFNDEKLKDIFAEGDLSVNTRSEEKPYTFFVDLFSRVCR